MLHLPTPETIKPLLIFPPGWTPFGPYLALPALKGYLDVKGISSEVWDLNVDFFDYIFDSSFLEKAYQKALTRFQDFDKKKVLDENEQKSYKGCIRALLSKNVLKDIDGSKQTIRSKEYYQ